MDTNRTDYLYYDASQAPLEMKQLSEKRLGAVVQTLGEGMTKTGPAYLATYAFQPSGGSTGVFEINGRGQGKSFLLSPNGMTQVTDTSGTGGSHRCRPGFICLEASQQCMQELP